MVQEEEAKWKDVLPFAVVFLALSTFPAHFDDAAAAALLSGDEPPVALEPPLSRGPSGDTAAAR